MLPGSFTVAGQICLPHLDPDVILLGGTFEACLANGTVAAL